MFKESSRNGADNYGPFAGPGGSRDRQIFLAVKPICVEILGHCRPGKTASPQLAQSLGSLRSLLDARFSALSLPAPMQPCAVEVDQTSPPVGVSLLHYAFFPIAQLFQASPKGPADLPDRTRQEAFACLQLLVNEWWRHWLTIGTTTAQDLPSASTPKSHDQAQVWRQFLILAAVTLTHGAATSQSKDHVKAANSTETSLAVVRLLYSLLVPRVEAVKPKSTSKPQDATKSWEWDGESDLPSLDELDEEIAAMQLGEQGPKAKAKDPLLRTLFPAASHQALCNQTQYKSPLLHALTACLDIASEPDTHSTMVELKSTALEVSRIIASFWVAPPESSASARATKMAPILPGITSKIVRLLTSSGGDDGAKMTVIASPTRISGPLVARALTLLTEVCQVVLNDEATEQIRASSWSHRSDAPARLRSLEEVVASLEGEQEDIQQSQTRPSSSSAGKSAGPSKNDNSSASLGLTIKNLTLSMHTLAFETSKSSPMRGMNEGLGSHSHPLAQQALVSLCNILLSNCTDTLLWYEKMHSETSDSIESASQPSMSKHLNAILMRWLLDFDDSQGDSHLPRSTADAANAALKYTFRRDVESGNCQLCIRLGAEVTASLHRIPTEISSRRGADMALLCRRASAALRIMAWILNEASEESANLQVTELVARFLRQSQCEKWGQKLIGTLQVSGDTLAQFAGADGETSELVNKISPLGVQSLDAREARSLSDMLRDFGALCGTQVIAQSRHSGNGDKGRQSSSSDAGDLLTIISYFLDRSRYLRRLSLESSRNQSQTSLGLIHQSTTSLYIAREMITGATTILQDSHLALQSGKKGRRARKIAHKLAQELVNNVLECWNEETALKTTRAEPVPKEKKGDGQLLAQDDLSEQQVSHTKGFPSLDNTQELTARPQRFGPALNLSFVDAAVLPDKSESSSSPSHKTIQTRIEENKTIQRSLQLSLLSLSSALLGPSFRTHLLPVLYPTISALANADITIAQSASNALKLISHSAGYADLLTCVRENVDYILGEASWRLVSGLGRELEIRASLLDETRNDSSGAVVAANVPLLSSLSPPLVLTEVMRLLGPESLHLIEDSIDEVLDALDRFHGYNDICESLLGVLDRLLAVMREGAEQEQNQVGAQESVKEGGSSRARPSEVEQLQQLDQWLVKRHHRQSEDVESAFDRVERDQPEDGEESPSGQPTAANRSQRLVAAILEKSMPFLSHANTVVRARVLRILGAGTELLCPLMETNKWQRREDELLPLVNRAWPLILSRLGWDVNRRGVQGTTSQPRKRAALPPNAEQSPAVHLAAIDLCRIFGLHIPAFMARRISEDGWQRMRNLLAWQAASVQNEQDVKMSHSKTRLLRGHDGNEKQHIAHKDPEQRHIRTALHDPHSPLSQLLSSTIGAITPLVSHQGPSFPSATLWEILSHPLIIPSLDETSPIRNDVLALFKATRACDGYSTAWSIAAGTAFMQTSWGSQIGHLNVNPDIMGLFV
ncbi:unnamed protein product [Sympodiomycopsis kandeliae]